MDTMQSASKPNRALERRNTIFPMDSTTPDPSQIKSELVLQQRKYERLEQKEKRIQVFTSLTPSMIKVSNAPIELKSYYTGSGILRF